MEEASLTHELHADQAQAELEAALHASAAVNGARVEVSWIHTHGEKARFWVYIDFAYVRRQWIRARNLISALGLVVFLVGTYNNYQTAGAWALFVTSVAWLATARKLHCTPIVTPEKIISDATKLVDRFDTDAHRRPDGVWDIGWTVR